MKERILPERSALLIPVGICYFLSDLHADHDRDQEILGLQDRIGHRRGHFGMQNFSASLAEIQSADVLQIAFIQAFRPRLLFSPSAIELALDFHWYMMPSVELIAFGVPGHVLWLTQAGTVEGADG
jgi:hypothetical protein